MEIQKIISQNFTSSLLHLNSFEEKDALGPVQRAEALLLFGLVAVTRPKTIVEFGFSRGHSSLNFLQALQGSGKVFSFDISSAAEEIARQNFNTVENFKFIRKAQQDFSAQDIDNREIDFLFFDGAHELVVGRATFAACLPSLSAEAIVAVHDTGVWNRCHFSECHRKFSATRRGSWLNGEEFQHQKEEREFVNWIANQFEEFQVIHLHSKNCIRHGLTLLQRRRLLEI
jgi:predicted O-methyltransferase YrrM